MKVHVVVFSAGNETGDAYLEIYFLLPNHNYNNL